ncbi:hypothetical protein IAT38_005677 [Cryptococcus sp. DSM 104549]
MAGGHGEFHAVKLDDAVERWGKMRAKPHIRFQFTPRVTRHVIGYMVVIPAVFTYFVVDGLGKYDLSGKQRGSSLRSGTPAKPEPVQQEE